MSRGIIFGTGFVALVLLAFLCIPRHLPETASGASHPNFTATISNGQLTLSGGIGSARAKQAVLARAQELAKSAKLRVGEELTVLPNDGKLDAVLPSLLASLTSLHSQQASLSLSDQTVTVQGTAASDDVKTKLLHEVSSLVGNSMRVQDRIAVTPPATVSLPPPPGRHGVPVSCPDAIRAGRTSARRTHRIRKQQCRSHLEGTRRHR